MYHEVRYAQTLAGSADEMEEAAQGLIESTDRLFSLLAAASGNTLAAIKESVGARDRFFGAEDAVRAGFMDGVLRPVRYYGPANPWGWKIDTPRSPLQRTGKRVLQLGEKIEPRPAAATLTLRGELEEMRAYQIIGQLVSHIALYPDRNVKLEITNSPGGIIDGGLGIFDVMRLINALPNCGNVTTLGRGNSIEGMSALLLAGGKLGNRDIYPEATMVLGDIQVAAAPYTPATRVLEASEEAARISDLLLDGFGRHSGLSPVAIRESIAGGEEGGRFEMLPEEAVGHRFVDRLIG